MGYRLTKIYTRTGDKGTTQVGRNKRADKNEAIVETFGDLDELNSVIGIVVAQSGLSERVSHCLATIQQTLFNVGAELFLPEAKKIQQSQIDWLENKIDELNENLPYLKEFVLPGGHPAAAHCHFARSVCRRAERHLVAANKSHDVNPYLLAYINRLSDLLFVIARVINHDNDCPEILWKSD